MSYYKVIIKIEVDVPDCESELVANSYVDRMIHSRGLEAMEESGYVEWKTEEWKEINFKKRNSTKIIKVHEKIFLR